MNNNKMNPNARLSFLERFAYGIGDYAGNLVYSAISAFLLVYYTNVVGASAAAAASIIAISKIFDGISDLVMGYIIDHTHSKWGKARPWIARLCIPLAVCTVLTFIVLMIVFVILNMFTFFMCKERVVESGSDQKETKENRISFFKGIKGLFVNKYWVLLVIAIFAMYFMMSCFFGSAVYFAQYNVGNAGKYAIISNCLSMAQIAFLFVTPFIMKKVSKKNLFMCGMAVSGIGFLLSGFTTNVTLTCVLSVVKGMGFACGGASMFGLLQDAITYGEWYNGYGTAGMGNAASSFCMKVGSGIGTAALGWVLGFGGFDAKNAVQSAKALAAINWSFAWIPFIMVVIVVICMVFFDLDKKYDQVIADLEQGKHRNDQ